MSMSKGDQVAQEGPDQTMRRQWELFLSREIISIHWSKMI
jgi:hypothetical protein